MSYEQKPINTIKKPMNSDYLELDNAEGMPGLVDSTIALTFLINVKSAIRNFAMAITEIADPEAKNEIRKMLDIAIDLHAQTTELMINKGWLHPHHVNEQFKLDKISTKTALQIAGLELFPGDTSRLGSFATPNY